MLFDAVSEQKGEGGWSVDRQMRFKGNEGKEMHKIICSLGDDDDRASSNIARMHVR